MKTTAGVDAPTWRRCKTGQNGAQASPCKGNAHSVSPSKNQGERTHSVRTTAANELQYKLFAVPNFSFTLKVVA